MSTIDRQRIAAVRMLEALGYRFDGQTWRRREAGQPNATGDLVAAADAMHDELSGRLEDLAGATGDSDEAAELERISELLDLYQNVRPKD